MGNRHTFIAVPSNVKDPNVLKRFLDKLVEQVDIAFNKRGSAGFATSTDLVSTATTVEEVVADINTLSTRYVKLDSSNLDAELKYKSAIPISPLGLVHRNYVDSKYIPQSAPAKINSGSTNAEIKQVSDKVDELIDALKLSGILV